MTNYSSGSSGPGYPSTPGGLGQPPGYTDPTLYPPNVDRPAQSPRSDDPNTTRNEARQVADTTREAGANVAQTAKEQVADVAAETKEQVTSLLDTVRFEVGQQAGTQQQRIARALHDLSGELGSMASSSPQSGAMTQLVEEGSRRGGAIAHWLSEREPGDVLEEVRMYARRRPMTFLALCGLTGLVAGRLTRSAVATRTSIDSHSVDEHPRTVAGPRAVPSTEPDPWVSASAVDPRVGAPTGPGTGIPPQGGVTPVEW